MNDTAREVFKSFVEAYLKALRDDGLVTVIIPDHIEPTDEILAWKKAAEKALSNYLIQEQEKHLGELIRTKTKDGLSEHTKELGYDTERSAD